MSLLRWWLLLLLLFLSLSFSADDVGDDDDDESTELIEFLERKSEREGGSTTVGADKIV